VTSVACSVALVLGCSACNDKPRKPRLAPSAVRADAGLAPGASAMAAGSGSASASGPVAPSPAIVVPASVAGSGTRRPFVLLLHGYSGSGSASARHFDLGGIGERRRFSWAAPDGGVDRHGARFWNAGPSCCDFDHSGVDHVAALSAILGAARANPAVDPDRLYVVGYSNGGFMAQRLGCELGGIAGIASVSGAAPTDLGHCPSSPRTVIHAHGDADVSVHFEGGRVLDRTDVAPHPSAVEGLLGWARHLGCEPRLTPLGRLDLEPATPGSETQRLGVAGCATRLELWRVGGGGHDIVATRPAFELLLSELMGEPR
jgi:polyhydroxybutyrate depolymerase